MSYTSPINIILTDFNLSFFFTSSVISNPNILGSITSSIATEGSFSSISCRAIAPSGASIISYPSFKIASTIPFLKTSLSWAIRTLNFLGGTGGGATFFLTENMFLHLAHLTLIPSGLTFASSIITFTLQCGHKTIIFTSYTLNLLTIIWSDSAAPVNEATALSSFDTLSIVRWEIFLMFSIDLTTCSVDFCCVCVAVFI